MQEEKEINECGSDDSTDEDIDSVTLQKKVVHLEEKVLRVNFDHHKELKFFSSFFLFQVGSKQCEAKGARRKGGETEERERRHKEALYQDGKRFP